MVRLRDADPLAFAKIANVQTLHPLLFKSGKETTKIQRILTKYGNKKEQEERAAKEKAIFGVTDLATEAEDTTCSSSEENEEVPGMLILTREELKMLSEDEKFTYLCKLEGDFRII